jgi:hypothetical protein
LSPPLQSDFPAQGDHATLLVLAIFICFDIRITKKDKKVLWHRHLETTKGFEVTASSKADWVCSKMLHNSIAAQKKPSSTKKFFLNFIFFELKRLFSNSQDYITIGKQI